MSRLRRTNLSMGSIEQFRPASFTHMGNPYCLISPTAVMRGGGAHVNLQKEEKRP